MTTVYLEIDDEITSAAARIRTAEDVDVALVLPAGSRIATSRINFRLLAREASDRGRRLAIVAPEPSTRALAASAGLPVFASVVELEDAGRPAGEADDGGGRGPSPAAAGRAAGGGAGPAAGGARGRVGAEPPPVGPGGGVARGVGAGPAPASASRTGERGPGAGLAPGEAVPRGPAGVGGGRPHGQVGASTGLGASAAGPPARRRRWPLVVALALGATLLAGTGAAVGYVLLPAATITLRLVSHPVGPIVFTGIADPAATAVDAATAAIPATRLPLALSVTGTFPATGKRVVATPASGQVRWTNCDPTRAYTIPQGTLARTGAGIAFRTAEAVFLPVAIIAPPRITCQSRTVDVAAVKDGPAGNVAAGAITVVPGEYNDVVIKVTNPAATSGGSREEFPQVAEEDVVAAVAQLTGELDAQLATAAASPPAVPPGGIVYPQTARRGDPVPSATAADLVGTEAATFDLTLTAAGTVVAVDPAPLEALGAERVAAKVPDGMALLGGSTSVTVGDGIVAGETVRYPVEARAEAVRSLTEDAVRALVKGRTAAEARAALAEYGAADVALWPDWVATVTSLDARLVVVIEDVPPAGPTPSPPAPTGPPTAAP
ncbi:MAG: hypothetical protein M0T75_06255 [Chloroflexi bacterium]|nr:hypothetical protein [Chloroflexota bacterium]